MICYQGQCVNKSNIIINYTPSVNPCKSNHCKNGGTCNSINSFFTCQCPFQYSGIIILINLRLNQKNIYLLFNFT